MSKLFDFIRRTFFRRQPPPRSDYLPLSELPGDAAEMVRAGSIRPWRVEAATGEQWYRIDGVGVEDGE